MVRERRSAKTIVEDLASELMARSNDPLAKTKLITLETIASRMGWNDLYYKLRNHARKEYGQKWWND